MSWTVTRIRASSGSLTKGTVTAQWTAPAGSEDEGFVFTHSQSGDLNEDLDEFVAAARAKRDAELVRWRARRDAILAIETALNAEES